MTRDQAIKAIQEGKRLTHRHFSPEEWVTCDGDYYKFEDGGKCPKDEFWGLRTGLPWEDGWSLFGTGASGESFKW